MSGDPYFQDDSPDRSRRKRTPRAAGRARRIGILASSLLTLLVIAVGVVGGGYLYFKGQYEGEGPLAQDRTFIVAQGMGLEEIASELEQQGFIEDSRMFIAGALIDGTANKLKAGEYQLRARVSMAEIMEALVDGRSVQHKLTIPEGLTSAQIVQRVKDHPVLVGAVTDIPAEGTLLPDTYVFLRGMTRQKLIERMREAQKKVLAELWPEREDNLPIDTPLEAVILASIVEKETSRAEERHHVASVFINRLKRKMRLQSDPTIIYGIVGGKGSLDRPITKADIADKTAYNTYQISGLPPTPISNPGVEAIKAVLDPAETHDLYFVADGTGGHAFAANLAGHNRNVALWRKIEAERRRLAEAEEAAAAEAAMEKAEVAAQSDGSAGPADIGRAAATEVERQPEVARIAEPPPPPPPPPPAYPSEERAATLEPVSPQGAGGSGTGDRVASVTTEVAPDGAPIPVAPPLGEASTGDETKAGKNWREIAVPRPRPKPDLAALTADEPAVENLLPLQIGEPAVVEDGPAGRARFRRRTSGNRAFPTREGFR